MLDEKNNRPLEYATPDGEWMRPDMRVAVFCAGGLFMFVALVATNVTFADPRHYGPARFHGFLAALGAVVCFFVGCWRGGWGWKLGAVAASAPSLWVGYVFANDWL